MVCSVSVSAVAHAPVVLIATDVFGHTAAVDGLVRQLAQPALIVSPFEDSSRHFVSEQEAYQAFLAEGGIARFADKLAAAQLAHTASLRYAIGFSAGASALWVNSEHSMMSGLRQMVLFYGSRIREYRQLQPQCPVRLIFAEQEAAFAPAELVQDLQKRGHQAELLKGSKHGFMNVYSRGSCVKSQTRYGDELYHMMQDASIADAA